MNTEKFCKEFEKIFGKYKSYRVHKRQRILCGCKKMATPPYATFLYEVALYLDVPVSEAKKLLSDDCRYLFPLCEHVCRCCRKKFRKNCQKTGLATYISDSNLRKCFIKYRYVN